MTDAKFPQGRKLLALYPVLLFYLSLAWIVLIGFQQTASQNGAVSESSPNNSSDTTTDQSNSDPNSRMLLESLSW